MASRQRAFAALLICACLMLAVGCGGRPTFPKARLAESLQELLTAEQLDASVRFIDHTLAVQLSHEDSLAQEHGQIGLGPGFEDVARRVIMAIHRVLLSSDAEVRFYVLLLSDPEAPGAYLTLVRYMDDVRRANANVIDTPEMFARTIFDLNFVGQHTLTLEQYVPRDIRLEEFLSWQLARRIQQKLADEFQAAGLAQVGRCGGTFENGEFAFTLNIAPVAERSMDEAMMRKVFETSTSMIAGVLSSYRFQSFNAIRLIHPSSGRHLVLPKAHLEIFR